MKKFYHLILLFLDRLLLKPKQLPSSSSPQSIDALDRKLLSTIDSIKNKNQLIREKVWTEANIEKVFVLMGKEALERTNTKIAMIPCSSIGIANADFEVFVLEMVKLLASKGIAARLYTGVDVNLVIETPSLLRYIQRCRDSVEAKKASSVSTSAYR